MLPESPSARNVKIPLKKDLGFQCSGVLETSTPAVFPFFSDKPSFRFCRTHAHTQQAYVVSLHIHTRGHRMHSAASRPHDYIQLTRYDCFNECILKESMRFSLWSGTYVKYFFTRQSLTLRRMNSEESPRDAGLGGCVSAVRTGTPSTPRKFPPCIEYTECWASILKNL